MFVSARRRLKSRIAEDAVGRIGSTTDDIKEPGNQEIIEGRMVCLPLFARQRNRPTRSKVVDIREVIPGIEAEIGRKVGRIMEEQDDPENRNQAE